MNQNIYLDPNNLYGYAMSKFLPTRGFKWTDPKEFDLNKYSSNNSKRCVLEVDLEYLKNYENYTIIILYLQIKWKSKEKCYLSIN